MFAGTFGKSKFAVRKCKKSGQKVVVIVRVKIQSRCKQEQSDHFLRGAPVGMWSKQWVAFNVGPLVPVISSESPGAESRAITSVTFPVPCRSSDVTFQKQFHQLQSV